MRGSDVARPAGFPLRSTPAPTASRGTRARSKSIIDRRPRGGCGGRRSAGGFPRVSASSSRPRGPASTRTRLVPNEMLAKRPGVGGGRRPAGVSALVQLEPRPAGRRPLAHGISRTSDDRLHNAGRDGSAGPRGLPQALTFRRRPRSPPPARAAGTAGPPRKLLIDRVAHARILRWAGPRAGASRPSGNLVTRQRPAIQAGLSPGGRPTPRLAVLARTSNHCPE